MDEVGGGGGAWKGNNDSGKDIRAQIRKQECSNGEKDTREQNRRHRE